MAAGIASRDYVDSLGVFQTTATLTATLGSTDTVALSTLTPAAPGAIVGAEIVDDAGTRALVTAIAGGNATTETISVSGAASSITTDATLAGDGTSSDPLKLNVDTSGLDQAEEYLVKLTYDTDHWALDAEIIQR
jgi:hypothetical protein